MRTSLLITFCFLFCFFRDVYAEILGTFAIIGNSVKSSISISVNDRASRTNSIQIISSGQAGQFRLINYPPYTRLLITPLLPQITSVFAGTTEQFTLTEIDIQNSVITDSSGEASIRVGGTLESSGNGGSYLETIYNLNIMLSVNY